MAPAWMFPEFSPVGVDLASADAVARYDHDQGTDPARDGALLDRLGVGPGTIFVDLACGTGRSLVVEATRRGADAHGVDVFAFPPVESTDFPRPTHGEFVCRRR
jgi:putative AdoMet-dependent methyltransferase